MRQVRRHVRRDAAVAEIEWAARLLKCGSSRSSSIGRAEVRALATVACRRQCSAYTASPLPRSLHWHCGALRICVAMAMHRRCTTTGLGISRSSPSSRGTLARCMAFTRNFATRFTADDLARLDRVATHHGLTRASTLRMLISQAAALLPPPPAAPPVVVSVARPRAKKRRATKR